MLTTKASTFYLHEMAKKCATDVGKRKKIIKKNVVENICT